MDWDFFAARAQEMCYACCKLNHNPRMSVLTTANMGLFL
jgi:hypothetical protein